MISQFYISRNVAFSTEEDDDVFDFDADEVENSNKERQGRAIILQILGSENVLMMVNLCKCFNNVTLTLRQTGGWLQLKILSDV